MCGLSGFWITRCPVQGLERLARSMADTLFHRGPDDGGVWVDRAVGIGLGHRRLAILDLSAAGHQPMVSASGRYLIAVNGEIYNHLELRRELNKGGVFGTASGGWHGHSDTETLLAAFETWGVEGTLRRSVGMFALALWDRQTCTLTLARDRLGEKPLYYGRVGGALVFGSELKAIRAYPGFDNPVERRAVALFMRHNYIPAPWSIYRDIWKLPAGTYVQFRAEEGGGNRPPDVGEGRTPCSAPGGRGEPVAYWSARAVAEQGLVESYSCSEDEAVEELDRLLRRSLSGQMISDVPLGAFLSGGIDSSTVVALMQAMSSRPVKTFTIGFHEGEYDEAQHAKAVARHLGTEHTEWYVTPDDALAVIPSLPELYDEPFADSSQIPSHLLCAAARREVTVALSGDGGDELFGGYNRYFWAVQLWRRLGRMPVALRVGAARFAMGLSTTAWNRVFGALFFLLPNRLRFASPGDKVHKAAALLAARQPEEIYVRLVSHWEETSSLVLGAEEPATPITDPSAWLDCPDFERRMMYLDTITYLPDDVLVKVDRAAMGVGLETRVPLLDHRIVEFAWRLPLSMKIRKDQGKWALRHVLYKYVPREIVERPKMGFGVPIDHWLRGPLREWAEDLLSEDRLRREGFLDPSPVRAKWAEHLSGRRNWQYLLWDVLMFEAWLDRVRT